VDRWRGNPGPQVGIESPRVNTAHQHRVMSPYEAFRCKFANAFFEACSFRQLFLRFESVAIRARHSFRRSLILTIRVADPTRTPKRDGRFTTVNLAHSRNLLYLRFKHLGRKRTLWRGQRHQQHRNIIDLYTVYTMLKTICKSWPRSANEKRQLGHMHGLWAI